jgi:ATP-dependent protease ClpP protease subunit
MNHSEKKRPENETEASDREAEQVLDTIDRSASVAVKNGEEAIYCLSVIGQIEGHYLLPEGQKATKYEQLIPLLVSVEENKEFDGLLVILNTMGGDVEAGLALAELIASMKKPTVTLVLGGGHSIGIPLAVSGRKTFIAPSASMTIHPVRMSGTMIAAPQTYHYFDRIQERIIRFVAKNSHIKPEKFRELMLKSGDMSNDVGSVVYGEEAVALGLMDQVGTLHDALEALYGMMKKQRKQEKEDA